MFEAIKEKFGKAKAGFTRKFLETLLGNTEMTRKMAKTISGQIIKNFNGLNCDACRLMLFETDAPDMAFLENYGAWKIDRNRLLILDGVPAGILTFERIKDFLPDMPDGIKTVFQMERHEGKLFLTVFDYETKDVIVSKEAETFIFDFLTIAAQDKEKIVEHIEGISD